MFLYDTNVFIALFQADALALQHFREHSARGMIHYSLITLCELLTGASSEKEENAIIRALSGCASLAFDSEKLCLATARWRKEHKLKTPDAILLATAESHHLHFITFDRDFKKIKRPWITVL